MIEATTTGYGRLAQQLPLSIDDLAHKRTSVLTPHIHHNDTVLEYGCGDGRVLSMLPGREKAGVETNPHAARLARDRGLDVRSGVDEFKELRFSRIVCSVDLEAVAHMVEPLARLRSLLVADGLLMLSQPVDGCQPSRPAIWRAHTDLPSQLASLLVDAGYQPQRIAFERQTCRSAGFRFANGKLKETAEDKTYWVVTPFIALIAIARPGQES